MVHRLGLPQADEIAVMLQRVKSAQEAATRVGYRAKATGALMRRLDVQTAVVADENRARNRVLRHTAAQIKAQLGNLASATSPSS